MSVPHFQIFLKWFNRPLTYLEHEWCENVYRFCQYTLLCGSKRCRWTFSVPSKRSFGLRLPLKVSVYVFDKAHILSTPSQCLPNEQLGVYIRTVQLVFYFLWVIPVTYFRSSKAMFFPQKKRDYRSKILLRNPIG